MKRFCMSTNLKALTQDPRLPESFHEFCKRLQRLFNFDPVGTSARDALGSLERNCETDLKLDDEDLIPLDCTAMDLLLQTLNSICIANGNDPMYTSGSESRTPLDQGGWIWGQEVQELRAGFPL